MNSSTSSMVALDLDSRRRDLGMTLGSLATRSGVSTTTINRILGHDNHNATLGNIAAVAQALGVNIRIEPQCSPEEYRRKQAEEKAEFLVKMVQGTCALEGQAVDVEAIRGMVSRTIHELMVSNRRLWG